jgi:hypothetical protein
MGTHFFLYDGLNKKGRYFCFEVLKWAEDGITGSNRNDH